MVRLYQPERESISKHTDNEAAIIETMIRNANIATENHALVIPFFFWLARKQVPGHLRALCTTHSTELVLVFDDRIILRDIRLANDYRCKHVHQPPGRGLSTTRPHRRCRTHKGRPVSSRTALPVTLVRHSERVGGKISRLPTTHQTVHRSGRRTVPSLAFRRFSPCARGPRAWIPPSCGLVAPAPDHERRDPERLCSEVTIYSASV